MPQATAKFDEGHQKIRAQRDPQLRPHRVHATAHEALHLQVLFDPLEEQLHSPPLLVQCRHRGCRNIQGVGHKLVFLTSRFIQKADCPEHALHSSEPDFPVFQDTRAFAPAYVENDPVNWVDILTCIVVILTDQ